MNGNGVEAIYIVAFISLVGVAIAQATLLVGYVRERMKAHDKKENTVVA